jgi:hypothetical protein
MRNSSEPAEGLQKQDFLYNYITYYNSDPGLSLTWETNFTRLHACRAIATKAHKHISLYKREAGRSP